MTDGHFVGILIALMTCSIAIISMISRVCNLLIDIKYEIRYKKLMESEKDHD